MKIPTPEELYNAITQLPKPEDAEALVELFYTDKHLLLVIDRMTATYNLLPDDTDKRTVVMIGAAMAFGLRVGLHISDARAAKETTKDRGIN